MSDEARAEAVRIVGWNPVTGRRGAVEHFIKGAEWQASRKVEVTDEMVAKAARAAYVADNYGVASSGADWDEGRLQNWVIDRHLRLAHAALTAL